MGQTAGPLGGGVWVLRGNQEGPQRADRDDGDPETNCVVQSGAEPGGGQGYKTETQWVGARRQVPNDRGQAPGRRISAVLPALAVCCREAGERAEGTRG